MISLLMNSLKKSIGRPGFAGAKLFGRRSWAGLGGLFRGKALKLGTTALCLILTCSSRSWHSSVVRCKGSLAQGTGSA